jgi:Tol biopolymer transport system component
LAPWAAAQSLSTTRASVSTTGVQGAGASLASSISLDSRYVAFTSAAPNLVAGDTNVSNDVFLKDRLSQVLVRVSLTATGGQALGNSGWDGSQAVPSSLSLDGRVVAFCSVATNLVSGDTNGQCDVFVRDLLANTTQRVSVGAGGVQAAGASRWNSLSADGRYVAFPSTANNLVAGDGGHEDVFVHDRVGGTTTLESLSTAGIKGVLDSSHPSISGSGQWVAFHSYATFLDPQDTNSEIDVFLRDRNAGTLVRISAAPGGAAALGGSRTPAISSDGNFVAYVSGAPNLVPGDTNGLPDVFVFDRLGGTTARASVSYLGQEANFDSERPTLSADGRWCAFTSRATNLVAGDTNGQADVFVRDLVAGTTSRSSLTQTNLQSAGPCQNPAIAGDGRFVAFDSAASDLVPLDSNGVSDVFLRDRQGIPPETYCTPKLNSQGCLPSMGFLGIPSASLNSGFTLYATNVLNQQNGLLFYSTTGPASNVFQGGYFCCAQPLTRTLIQNSGGNPPPDDCSGLFSFDFNAYVQSGADPTLGYGSVVWSQYWGRDPSDPFTISLTDAVKFTLGD